VIFLHDFFPLIAMVQSSSDEEAEFSAMTTTFDRYFDRGERYALITTKKSGLPTWSPKIRKRVADWSNSARVRTRSKELCVGSAAVVEDTFSRGALTAILWLWTPASPMKVVPNNEDAVDYCLTRLREENVPLGASASDRSREFLAALKVACAAAPTSSKAAVQP
jgi:hypothetical protein